MNKQKTLPTNKMFVSFFQGDGVVTQSGIFISDENDKNFGEAFAATNFEVHFPEIWKAYFPLCPNYLKDYHIFRAFKILMTLMENETISRKTSLAQFLKTINDIGECLKLLTG